MSIVDQAIAALSFTATWKGARITYSVPVTGSTWPGYAADSEPTDPYYALLNTTQALYFRQAVSSWAKLINIPMVETNDLVEPGDIRAAISGKPTTSWAYIPSSQASAVAGDVWFGAIKTPTSNTALLVDSYGTINGFIDIALHELGHALGLKHPFEDGETLPAAYDTARYTVMSYTRIADAVAYVRTASGIERFYIEPSTPMLFDVLAIQAKYGASTTTNAGDTIFSFSATNPVIQTIYDAGGRDTIDTSNVARPSIIDLNAGSFSSIGIYAYEQQLIDFKEMDYSITFDFNYQGGQLFTWRDNLAIAYGVTIENAVGGGADDVIKGNAAANDLTGGGGADALDGGAGIDAALYAGASSDYSWTKTPDGAWTVTDQRSGRDGKDTLSNIEILRFSDKSVALSLSLPTAIETAFSSILRGAPGAAALESIATDLLFKLHAGLGEADALTSIIKAADASTSVATLAYAFFTGKIPGQAGIDYLVSPTGPNANNLNSAYYQSFNLENRYINFAVNLGKLGEGKEAFAVTYGALSLFDATREAYKTIFGGTPTDAKVHALIDSRVDYFAAYGADGANGIGTKAAMVGWLLAEAEKADVGVMARSNAAWLADLSDGSAPFAIDILDPAKGYYKADFIFGGA